ncbi:hypothetical protein GW931_02340 [archaeon]|nr:hypothetical protein [archaeon]
MLSGALVIGGCQCNGTYNGLEFNKNIDGEEVNFNSDGMNNKNILTVKKRDGKIIKYIDNLGDDLRVDYVEITKDGKTNTYSWKNAIGEAVIWEAQKEFDKYLEKVKRSKIFECLRDLKE